jgi:flagellin
VDEAGAFFVSKDGGANVISASFDDTTGEVTYDSADFATATAPAGALSSSLTNYEIPPVAVPAVTADLSGLDTAKVGSSATLHKMTNSADYVVKGQANGSDVYYKAVVDSAGVVTLGDELTPDPLASIDAALSKVDNLRGSLGAVQNRFDSAIANLGTTITNLSSSRSRIEDADYAVEVSNMTRANILQQAGTSVLAQANQTTQNVLSLLR